MWQGPEKVWDGPEKVREGPKGVGLFLRPILELSPGCCSSKKLAQRATDSASAPAAVLSHAGKFSFV